MKKMFKILCFMVTIVGLSAITAAEVKAEDNCNNVFQSSGTSTQDFVNDLEVVLGIKETAYSYDILIKFLGGSFYNYENGLQAYDVKKIANNKYDFGTLLGNGNPASTYKLVRDYSFFETNIAYVTVGMFRYSSETPDSYEVIVTYSNCRPPIILGPKTYAKNNDTSFDAKDLVPFLTAYDENDGDISNNIYVLTDDYNDSGVPGQYTVIYAVENSNEAVSTFEVTFNVMDVIKPIIYIPTDSFFTTAQVNAMTKQEIINLLVQTGQLDLD